MVDYRSAVLDATFSALADPTRRQIMTTLASGPQPVSALARPLPMSLVAVSKHIGVLERAGLVTRTREGRSQMCRLRPGALVDAASWISRHQEFWRTQLDSLESYLSEDDHGKP